MAITNLSISYPDFKLNDLIDPEQFDVNNADIQTKMNTILGVLNQITDSITDGGSGADTISLTSITPFASTKLQSYLEEVVTRLRATTDNVSGADLIGSTTITGVTGTTVQAQLESLKGILDTVKTSADKANADLTTHKTSNDHDARYYVKSEVDTKDSTIQSQVTTNASDISSLTTRATNVEGRATSLETRATNLENDKANKTDHYTKSLLDGGQLDTRYYTESETDNKLALKTDKTGDHQGTWQGYTPLSVSEGVNKQRIDVIEAEINTTNKETKTLTQGTQTVTALETTDLKVTSVKGRTLVNLLGKDGNCDNVAFFNYAPNGGISGTLVSDSAFGNNAIKLTTTIAYRKAYKQMQNIKANSYYVLGAHVKTTLSDARLYVRRDDGLTGNVLNSNIFAGNGGYLQKFVKFQAPSDNPTIWFNFESAVNGDVTVDGIRLYEITQAEYDALATMTTDQIAQKYPYVDSMQGTRNLAIESVNENLLPDFDKWSLHTNAKKVDDYKLEFNATANAQVGGSFRIKVIPSTNYYLSALFTSGQMSVYGMKSASYPVNYSNTSQLVSFNSGINDEVIVEFRSTTAGTFTFTNPMLNVGSTAKPFVKQVATYTYHNTTLHSIGTVADELVGNKVKRMFEEVTLDGSLAWAYSADYAGHKRVSISNFENFEHNRVATKYDGSILSGVSSTSPDSIFTVSGVLYITIADTDSGWGESYTPTVDEIKAYFYGWRMRNLNDTNPYSGTGTKAWGTIASGGTSSTTTLPTTPASDIVGQYKLVHQRATMREEVINPIGEVTLAEGNNTVSVKKGIVAREKVTPQYDSAAKNYVISATAFPDSFLKNKPEKILAVYKNNLIDSWTVFRGSTANGKELAYISETLFDKSATYYVDYEILPELSADVQPISAEINANIKAVVDSHTSKLASHEVTLDNLPQVYAKRVQEASMPLVLQNSWVNFGTGYAHPYFYKDDMGIVRFFGIVKLGTTSIGTVIATFPVGYRPSSQIPFPTVSNNGTSNLASAIDVDSSGRLVVGGGTIANNWLILYGSFRAEK